MNMGIPDGDVTLREKDLATIRKILARCAKRAADRLPTYERRKADIARRSLGFRRRFRKASPSWDMNGIPTTRTFAQNSRRWSTNVDDSRRSSTPNMLPSSP